MLWLGQVVTSNLMKSFEYHGVKECIFQWVGWTCEMRCFPIASTIHESCGRNWSQRIPMTLGTSSAKAITRSKLCHGGVQSEGRGAGICGAKYQFWLIIVEVVSDCAKNVYIFQDM